ncbi:MAG TPA: hypothetical protein PK874_00155 [Desulfobacteraceae bacterium]|nr:hypothetical protein [Desulfobacteraceae bacterium]HPJ66827.1 hypothetical protein [Desulfobacteraceae bacterium]
MCSKVFENSSGIKLLDSKAVISGCIFCVITGILLYPMALGIGRLDPYAFGWSFSFLFVILMIVTLMLILIKNRFSIVLILCILSYDVKIMESVNLWDYLVDPIFMIISFIFIVNLVIKKVSKKEAV